MIEISKAEAKYLRERGVKEGITRTIKQNSKRKHYFMCEDKWIVDLLSSYRKSQNVVFEYGEV